MDAVQFFKQTAAPVRINHRSVLVDTRLYEQRAKLPRAAKLWVFDIAGKEVRASGNWFGVEKHVRMVAAARGQQYVSLVTTSEEVAS